jgi:hypothetical protein
MADDGRAVSGESNRLNSDKTREHRLAGTGGTKRLIEAGGARGSSEASVRRRLPDFEHPSGRRSTRFGRSSAACAAAGPKQGSTSMATPDTLRYTSIPLTHGSGAIPALGFGTLIPDLLATKQATKTALEVGFRLLDCAESYRNEEAVGDAMQEAFKAGTIQREDVFVTTKLRAC